jgi:2-methylisocitrate lyase-like PEP mutase family enzyme
MPTQVEKAEALLKLHHGAGLLLPNAWDSASARLFEEAGFPAIATTSSGVAFANGFPDGQFIGRDQMLGIVKRIVAAVNIPVTADVEAGYGHEPEAVAQTLRGVIEAGAVGVNLEDNPESSNFLYPVEQQVARIKAGRAAADQAGVHVVINARIDTYLYRVGEESGRFDDTITRAKAYKEAGADSIFVPGVTDPALISKLVSAIPAPVNILVPHGAPPAPELFKLGVKRISVGGAVMQAALGLVREIARELHEHGTYTSIGKYPFTHGEGMALYSKK